MRLTIGSCVTGGLLAVVVLGSASPADAARWKRGTRPPGSTYTVRGACYLIPDAGTNECRWKINNGCVWTAESGTNQCDPAQYNTATLTATNGTVRFQSVDDRDGNPYTVLGDVIATYGKTGEVVTTRVHLELRASDPLYVKVRSATVTGVQGTNLSLIAGRRSCPVSPDPSRCYPWTIERGLVVNAQGVRVPAWGFRPPSEYALDGTVPPAPPPSGYACGVSYQDVLSQQVNCFGGWAGTAIEGAFQSALYDAYRSGVNCGIAAKAAGQIAGSPGTLATFASCEGIVAGTSLGYNLVGNIYLGYAGGYASYANQACNSINQARMAAYQNCQPWIPPVMP